MTVSTLTDRYLAAAARNGPPAQREELRRELAERIGDDVEARVAAGADPADAERATLLELGHPDGLVASYLDRPQYLIGPALYGTWKRLLRLLLIIVLAVVAVTFPMAQALAHRAFAEIVGSTAVALLVVAVLVTFWTTLVFAVLDRAARGEPLTEWTPDDLPEVGAPPRNQMTVDFVSNLVFAALLLLTVLGLSVARFRGDAGARVLLIAPETWVWLRWWLVALAVVDVVFWSLLYRKGRWTFWSAAAITALCAAFAVPVCWALWNDHLFNHAFLQHTGWQDWPELIAPGGVLAIVLPFCVVAMVAVWPIDGFLKARRAAGGVHKDT